MFNEKEYAQRRATLLNELPKASVAILVGGKESLRNGDAEYLFRQDSDFLYITGITEPEAVAVFLKDSKGGQYIVFNREKNPDIERWTGPRIGQEDACKIYGADLAFPISSMQKKLPELLVGREKIFYSMGKFQDWDNQLIACVRDLNKKTRSGVKTPEEFINIENILHEMRLRKSAHEIELMRKAAQISAKAHARAMQKSKPGLKEYELEAEIVYEFTRQGSRAPAYNTIVGCGGNSCILHYIANSSVLKEDELVLIDAGAEYENYAADITRTFPVSGRFSSEQRAIYDLVLQAQLAVIELIKPGLAWNELQEKAVEVISAGLIELGLLKGKLADVLAKQSYREFYMHNIGHWLGLDVHDVGSYKLDDTWRILEPGMVLTVEPGIYISSATRVATKWQNIGIRIEDDILVTEDGYDILSKDVPKHPDQVMELMQK